MKTNEQVLELNLQACQKENEELRFELKGIRGNMRKAFSLTPTSKFEFFTFMKPPIKLSKTEHHTAEKDKLYGELLSHRKKSDIAAAEHARLTKTHQRMALEKQQHASTVQHAIEDAKKYREQVEELLHVNATLKCRVEELHKANTVLQGRLEDHEANVLGEELEREKGRVQDLTHENERLMIEVQQAVTRAKQEEHMKLRIAQDCEELVKGNVTLKNELEDVQRRLRRVRFKLRFV
ncbi:hypothetical protein BC830DRAFT_81580 [Chytriomyces sp. MP71]|nr:hypothetical protein BC830DRAFT_81580 [Chytriomyces sp. MP71]